MVFPFLLKDAAILQAKRRVFQHRKATEIQNPHCCFHWFHLDRFFTRESSRISAVPDFLTLIAQNLERRFQQKITPSHPELWRQAFFSDQRKEKGLALPFAEIRGKTSLQLADLAPVEKGALRVHCAKVQQKMRKCQIEKSGKGA
jgi:hypothetical protein